MKMESEIQEGEACQVTLQARQSALSFSSFSSSFFSSSFSFRGPELPIKALTVLGTLLLRTALARVVNLSWPENQSHLFAFQGVVDGGDGSGIIRRLPSGAVPP